MPKFAQRCTTSRLQVKHPINISSKTSIQVITIGVTYIYFKSLLNVLNNNTKVAPIRIHRKPKRLSLSHIARRPMRAIKVMDRLIQDGWRQVWRVITLVYIWADKGQQLPPSLLGCRRQAVLFLCYERLFIHVKQVCNQFIFLM